MDYDLWRQWQGFADLMYAGSQSRPAHQAAAGFAPFAAAAERFTAAARTFFDGHAAASAPAAADAARAFSDFLRDQFSGLDLPWSTGFGAAAGAASPSSKDSPALGPTREHQQRWQRAAEAWQRMNEAQQRLQRLWDDTLREAAASFAARSARPAGADAGPDAIRKLYDAWIDCAEEAYARTAHSEVFCSALAEIVNASSDWRKELQASGEHWAKQLDLPTRSEINSLNARLKALEAQQRAAGKGGKPRAAAGGTKAAGAARRARRKVKR
jgi:BMFP domain-containing protein YqiC